jgi:hypothetical protein
VNVGFRLYREVLDFAPAGITSGELVVALVLADDANDKTRASWMPLELLCHRARQQPSTVRSNLAKLGGRGLEFRVPHGSGKDGRPVFAVRGHRTDYHVPDFIIGATSLAPIPVDNPPKGAADLAAIGGERRYETGRKALAKPPKGASSLAPLPSVPSVSTSTKELPVITPPVEVSPNGTFDWWKTHIDDAAGRRP